MARDAREPATAGGQSGQAAGNSPAAARPASEAIFEGLLETAPDAILVVDRDGRIVLANGEAERMFGYDRRELVGESVDLLLPEQMRELHARHRAGYAAEPRTRPMGAGLDLVARRKDGSEFPVEISLSPSQTDRGLLVTSIIRDITDRKRAEAERARLLREQAVRAAAEASARRSALLAEASGVLAASLDCEAALASVARLVVPELADWCVVDLVEPDGSVRRVAVAHAGPEEGELARRLRRHAPDPAGPHPIAEALRRGEPDLMAEVTSPALEARIRDAEHRELLRALGLESYIAVPLLARGRTLGAIWLLSVRPERRYGQADLMLAQELGRRAALAVDNARLYREARQAHADLRRQLDVTGAVTRSLGEGLYTLDCEGRITFVNPAAARMLGWGPADLVGRDIHETVHPASGGSAPQPPAPCSLHDGLRSGAPFQGDDVFTRRDGTSLPVAVTRSPIVTDGTITGAVVIFRDITERLKAEAALRVHARQQAAVASLGQRALAGASLSELMDEAVRVVAETLGVEYAEVLELLPDGPALRLRAGVGWRDGYVGAATVSAGLDSQAGHTLRSGAPVIVEDLGAERRFDGPPLLRDHGVVSGASVIIAAQERPFGVLEAHSRRRRTFSEDDVHFLQAVANVLAAAVQRKRADDALARQAEELARLGAAAQAHEAFIRNVVESLRDGLVVLDRDGRVAAWNRAMERQYGFTAQEALGRPYLELFPAFEQEGLARALEPLLRGELEEFAREAVEHQSLRKGRVVLNIKASLLRENGTPAGAVLLIEDMTERVALERAARQADKMAALGTLAAGVAHELNNPVGIISARIELVLEEAESQHLPPNLCEDLRVLHRNAQRVAQIARGLLSFARRSSGERGPVDLNQVVEETLLLAGKLMTKEGFQVTAALTPDVPPVLGDANALQQVVLNLLNNAREAMPHGGEVRIATERAAESPGWVHLTVADNGPGIPTEVLSKIFDPFFTTKPTGTGLGLSVSYGIVRDHGGAMSVASRPGVGTTFTLTLPITDEAAVDPGGRRGYGA